MPVRLQLLGSPTVECEGESFALPFERRSQLLAFLALKRSWVGRAEVAAMLWPDQDNKLAYTNLRKTLFRLQSLPWAQRIDVRGGALRFDAETDVFAFESALREGRVGEALGVHHGELLPGFEDDESEAWSSWLGFERERLRSAWRGAVLSRLAADIEPREAIYLSARLLEADPLDESALRAHMSWLARDGQGAQARHAYREFETRLAEDLGIAPGTELQALHDSLAAAPGPAIVPARPADDGFVGRSVELRQIAALLAQPDCRLVSLVGSGGVGKTRLAQRALAELAGHHADGTAFVALEDARTGADVVAAIAREVGVAPAGRRDPLEQVADFLRERQVLLAIDNFEQLAAEAPILERLLKECPRLRMIVTSRVRIGLFMEQLLPLEGMPWPDLEDQDRFDSFDAVRLFVKAARRIEPGLVPEVEAAAIVDICRQVEGLPLALELAAAWTRVLSCEAIAAQLRDGAQLLHALDASKPARHSSLEVVFDQSWRLLRPVERDALARLSVFFGGFSPEAAKAVAGASLPVLGALVDKSLLRKEGGRLYMHPLLQSLAASRLEEGAAREETRRAHGLYFHRLMAQLWYEAKAGSADALRTLDIEHQNCRAAWHWALAHEMSEAVGRSALTLLQFYDHRFRFVEGLALLRGAIGSTASRADPRLEASLLASAAHFEYRLDHYAEAEADATRALAATEAGGDPLTRLQCFRVLGGCSLRLGRLDDARRYFRQVLRQTVDPHSAAGTLDNLALVEKALGNYAESLRLTQQSLVQLRQLGDMGGEALCLNNLGSLYVDLGELESARAHLREGLALCERGGLTNSHSLILANLTQVALKTGDIDGAEYHARRALEMADACGHRALESWLRCRTAELALRRGDLDGARADLAAALEIAIPIGRPSLHFSGISCFAEVLAAQGEAGCARRVLAFSAAHPTITAPDRDRIRAQMETLPAPADEERAWPGLGIDELLLRIVVERDVAHAPLIALLRAAGRG